MHKMPDHRPTDYVDIGRVSAVSAATYALTVL